MDHIRLVHGAQRESTLESDYNRFDVYIEDRSDSEYGGADERSSRRDEQSKRAGDQVGGHRKMRMSEETEVKTRNWTADEDRYDHPIGSNKKKRKWHERGESDECIRTQPPEIVVQDESPLIQAPKLLVVYGEVYRPMDDEN